MLKDALSFVRFPQMSLEVSLVKSVPVSANICNLQEFAENVALSGLLSDRELVSMFLHFTLKPTASKSQRPDSPINDEAIAKSVPIVSFPLSPRRFIGPELVVNRFQRIESSWGYSGTPDRIKFVRLHCHTILHGKIGIRFMVDVSIYVLGFGLYGSLHDTSTYAVTIEVSEHYLDRV